jgi:tRNA(fMet)-specific endonuclease VapC
MTPVRFMLDTDTCSFVVRGGNEKLRNRVRRNAGRLCVSAISVAELRYGARKKGSARISDAVGFFLELVDVVPWGEEAAARYAEIRVALESSGTPIGNMDTLIAASALADGCALVTHNTGHFGRVPGLSVQDWTV